jgi:hypothetical protein
MLRTVQDVLQTKSQRYPRLCGNGVGIEGTNIFRIHVSFSSCKKRKPERISIFAREQRLVASCPLEYITGEKELGDGSPARSWIR